MTPDSQPDSQHGSEGAQANEMAGAPAAAAKVPRAERLAQLGLRFTKGLPENIRDLVRARPTGFRYVLSDGKSDRAVPGLYLRVGAEGEGVFWLQYRVKLGEAKGERRQIHIGAVTLEAARREARQILGRVEAGGDPRAEERKAKLERARARASTLGAYFESVYQPEVLVHLADGRGAEARFRKVWRPLWSVPLAGIADAIVARILAKRKAEGIEAGTLHRDFAALRAALWYAVKRKIITAMPLPDGKPAPIAGKKMKPKERVRSLSDEPGSKGEPSERARFMAALAAERNLFISTTATLALSTGMRRANILDLADAKIHSDYILIPGEEMKAGKKLSVFLNADAKKALAGWTVRGMRGELFPVARFGGSKLARERKVERGWARLCRKAGVTDFHFHDARHDFASRMLRTGASLAMVRDALGHSSIAMTERYAHLERRDLRAAVQAVTL
jgi:integrase